MEKQAISVEQVKENFSINGEQAENVIKQLETIGVLGGRSEDGTHKVMMDKEAFTNRIRGYQSLAAGTRTGAPAVTTNDNNTVKKSKIRGLKRSLTSQTLKGVGLGNLIAKSPSGGSKGLF